MFLDTPRTSVSIAVTKKSHLPELHIVEENWQARKQLANERCHPEMQQKGQVFRVDIARTFGILKRANYRGYCSMEFDAQGDPYSGTAALIAQSLQYLGSTA